MTKRKANKSYNLIKSALCDSQQEKRIGYGVRFSSIDPAIEAWNAMSYRAKRSAVSDSRWNHYPLYSYSRMRPDRYGHAICMLVDYILMSGDEDGIKALTLASEGVFAVHAMDQANSSQRIAIAKRLLSSKDVRIRTRAAKILPYKYLEPMLRDKNYSVRNMALRRIGIDNCYKRYIPSDFSAASNWDIRYLEKIAVSCAEKNEVLHLVQRAKETSDFDWTSRAMLESLLRKLSKEEVMFMLDKVDLSDSISNLIRLKMTSKTND